MRWTSQILANKISFRYPYHDLISRSASKDVFLFEKDEYKMKHTFAVRDEDFKPTSWSKNNPKTCVAVAIKPEGVAVRNSNDPTKNTVFFTTTEWEMFVKGVKGDEFNI